MAGRSATRYLRAEVQTALAARNWELKWAGIRRSYPPKRIISPLFSALYASREEVRWHAVSGLGEVVADMAREKLESARVIMRRLLWSLNDESGGIGWGAPEAMGEIMARHAGLAQEYHHLLFSFLVPTQGPDNYLEYAPLRRGAYWGLARLAHARPELLQAYGAGLGSALERETDPDCILLICLALSGLDHLPEETRASLEKLSGSERHIRIYWQSRFVTFRLGELAQRALRDG